MTPVQDLSANPNQNPTPPRVQPSGEVILRYPEGATYGDPNLGTLFFSARPQPLPSFTPGLLSSLRQAADDARALIRHDLAEQGTSNWKNLVISSEWPGVFSLGGDLSLFVDAIRAQDREGITRYATECVELIYNWSRALDLPATSITLLEGTAQGGGLEMALASNLVVAERGVQLGFPETTFGLFSGMGALHYMSQRISMGEAQKIFLSGKYFTAEEFHERGLIDVLAEPGEGHHALLDILRDSDRKRHAREAVRLVRGQVNPVRYEDLLATVHYWVDAALTLSERELKLMERILKRQRHKLIDPQSESRD